MLGPETTKKFESNIVSLGAKVCFMNRKTQGEENVLYNHNVLVTL